MKKQTYYEKRLPELIQKLKSQVDKNMNVITLVVESGLGEEKYQNVLKGRRMACEHCLNTMKQIDSLEHELNPNRNIEESYYKEILPELIHRIKWMVDINLEVVDIEIKEETEDKLSEDKFHSVLKARETAGIDTEWALKKIDELERILHNKQEEKVLKKSWAKIAAEKR